MRLTRKVSYSLKMGHLMLTSQFHYCGCFRTFFFLLLQPCLSSSVDCERLRPVRFQHFALWLSSDGGLTEKTSEAG